MNIQTAVPLALIMLIGLLNLALRPRIVQTERWKPMVGVICPRCGDPLMITALRIIHVDKTWRWEIDLPQNCRGLAFSPKELEMIHQRALALLDDIYSGASHGQAVSS